MKAELQEIASQFALEGAITAIDSLGEGFINDTFIVRTAGDAPDYILPVSYTHLTLPTIVHV